MRFMSIAMSDASSTELSCVRGLSQACLPSQTQNNVHPNLEQLQAAVCTAAPDELQYFWWCWQSTSWHCSWLQNTLVVKLPTIIITLLGPYLAVTLELLPSIPQLAFILCVHLLNTSLVGGSEQSFNDDAPLFLFLSATFLGLPRILS